MPPMTVCAKLHKAPLQEKEKGSDSSQAESCPSQASLSCAELWDCMDRPDTKQYSYTAEVLTAEVLTAEV